jgi:HAD superfamily hydrolase (TIGR01509 family)
VTTTSSRVDTVVLDVDGTLVDSVYAHVWIWHEAFRAVGVEAATWQIHRAIGMGGDRLVEAVAGAQVERSVGDEVRRRHDERFEELLPRLAPTTGAVAFLEHLADLSVRVVLASSASRVQTADFISMLGAEPLIDGWVCGDDVTESKPAAEAVTLAMEKVGGTSAVVVGDSIWDVQAAHAAGQVAVGLLSGGVSRAELTEAGALEVFDDPDALSADLEGVLQRSVH